MLLATALLVGACFALGQAVLFLCGWPEPRWWAPAVGYGVLMIIFGLAVNVPRHQRLLLALAIAAVVVSVVFPFVRRSLRAALADAGLLGLLLLLVAAIPFFAYGHAGILGATVTDDMAQHLTAVFWFRDPSGMLPVAAIGGNLINTGYPLGPHALAAGLSRLGLGDVRGFDVVTLAVPVVTGMVVLGIVPNARRAARWALAAAIGLGYLMVAYLAQGSFKELILAMFVLATAVAVDDVLRGDERPGWRAAMPISLLLGGAVYSYSYGALLWLGAVVVFALGAEVFRRLELFSVVRRLLPAAIGAALLAAIVVAPEIHRMKEFRKSIFGQESLNNKGNLSHALNPLETLGVWFNGDFRFNPDPAWPSIVFCVVALAALVAGLVWWWRRRTLTLPAAAVAAVVVWAELALTVNIYNAAKGLVVLAPLVMTCIGAPLAAAWTRAPGRLPSVARVTGVVLVLGAAISSFAVLRSAPVGIGTHENEFNRIRTLVRHQPTLFLENDHFGEWELRGAKPLYTTNALYAPAQLGQHPQKMGGLPIDADNYGQGELDKLGFIVVAGAAYQSEIPPNFRLVLSTQSYDVYKRVGRTPTRFPYEDPGQPGAVFDCNSKRGRQYLKLYKWAGVLPTPVVQTEWRGSIARPGETARIRVKLPRGHWDVSLQYLSTTGLTVKAPGLTKPMAANFGLITAFWPAGTITSDGRAFTLSVTAHDRTWFADLLGKPRGLRAPLSPGLRPLNQIAFTRHGATPQRIPARAACGRYTDWFAPAGSRMRGR